MADKPGFSKSSTMSSPLSSGETTQIHRRKRSRPENYTPSDQQVAQLVTSSPTSTPELPSPLPCSCESVCVSQQMASPQTPSEPEPTPLLPSSPACSSESVRVSQQIASPQTSSEPESAPSNATTIRVADGVRLRYEDLTAEERRAISERVVRRLLLMNFGKLELPPKSDPCFKVQMMEDGTMVPDDNADGSRVFPEWVWEKYGPKGADKSSL